MASVAVANLRTSVRSIPKNAFSTLAETSTLSNGIKVVSQEMGTGSAVVGLSVNAGGRHAANGEAYLLKHLGFKGSESRSDIKLAREIEAAGVSVNCDANRDSIIYSASGIRANALGAGLEAVAESALSPKLIDWHVTDMKHEALGVELGYLSGNAEKQLMEKLHEASFGKHTSMGRAFYQMPTAESDAVAAYHSSMYTTGNMTVVGSGVGHSELVSAAEAAFGSAKKQDATALPQSSFVGGFASQDFSSSHVAVGFQGPALGSKEYADSLVLQEVWKQMALQQNGNSFNIAYQDGGLMGLYGGCAPKGAGQLTDFLVSVLKAPISDDHFKIAHMAVKTQQAVAAENASCTFSSLARGATNVDKASAAGVKALAAKLIKSTPTIASLGDDAGIPAYNTLAKMF